MEPHVSPVAASHDTTETLSRIFDAEKKFICTYKSLPMLWDTKHQHYTNKYKRHEALQTLLDVYKLLKPSATIYDVRMKINTLRSNYRRELKKVIYSRANAESPHDIYKPKSWSFELLHFLNVDIEAPTTTHDPDKSDNLATGEEYKQENELQEHKTGEFTSIYISPTRHVSNIRKRRKPEKRNTITPRNSKRYTADVLDASNPVALIWAEKLNRLQPDQRLFAEKAINDVLFEAELGNLNRFSVKINEAKDECSSTYADSFVSTHMQSPTLDRESSNTPSSSSSDDDNAVIKKEDFILRV